jgi:hypothetical protein
MKLHLELVGDTRVHGSKPRVSRLAQPSFDTLDALRLDVVRSAQEECKRDEAWRHSRGARAENKRALGEKIACWQRVLDNKE